MKLSSALSIILFAACGSSRPTPAGPPPPPTAPDAGSQPVAAAGAFTRADLLTGDWSVAGSEAPVAWLRPGGPTSAIYGVVGAGTPLVWAIDDAPDDAAVDDRHLVIFEYVGKQVRECDEQVGGEGLTFACGEGGSIAFRMNGSALDVEESTAKSGPDVIHLTPVDGSAGPALEKADQVFAADTAARGADGWVAHYEPAAVEWQGTTLIDGTDAIRKDITETLAGGALAWTPTASRMLVADGLGASAGTFTFTVKGEVAGTGTYLTLWKKEKSGWMVLLDTGRPDR